MMADYQLANLSNLPNEVGVQMMDQIVRFLSVKWSKKGLNENWAIKEANKLLGEKERWKMTDYIGE